MNINEISGDKSNQDIFYYSFLDFKELQKDKRSIEEINKELNLSQLGILGYNAKEAFAYLKKENKSK